MCKYWCPINDWSCPYIVKRGGFAGQCKLDKPYEECDDYASVIGNDWEDDDWDLDDEDDDLDDDDEEENI